jgi:hypothetical protein
MSLLDVPGHGQFKNRRRPRFRSLRIDMFTKKNVSATGLADHRVPPGRIDPFFGRVRPSAKIVRLPLCLPKNRTIMELSPVRSRSVESVPKVIEPMPIARR